MHEPSISELLPDTEERRAHNADIYQTARTVAGNPSPHRIRVNAVSPGLINTPAYSKMGVSPK